MNVILALALAIATALAAGYSTHGRTVHSAAAVDDGGPVPLCPPDAPSCN